MIGSSIGRKESVEETAEIERLKEYVVVFKAEDGTEWVTQGRPQPVHAATRGE
jgi:hypothetical protein